MTINKKKTTKQNKNKNRNNIGRGKRQEEIRERRIGKFSPQSRSQWSSACLPAAREGPGSNRAEDNSLCVHENHCDTQLRTRAAH